MLNSCVSGVWIIATRSPVFMGAMFDEEGSDYDYANYREGAINELLWTRLLNHAREWTYDQIQKFQLENFFKPADDGHGFVEAT